jgi:metal-responsive CopG/Arc/MetJ family transcriptional regulator
MRTKVPRPKLIAFSCRLPDALLMRLDLKRVRLRLRSRNAAIARAVDEFLTRHDTGR